MSSIAEKININKLFPFIRDARNYTIKKFKIDIMAGLTVAIVGTPQAIAYAIIAGVDPRYGLYACIIPVIVASLMGSSRFLVAGPTNTVSMVIFSTISTISIGGVAANTLSDVQKIELIFLIAVLVGIMQVLFGLAKAGSLLNFISHSVIVGFTAGAGILIGFNQIKNFLGLKIHTSSDFIESTIETFGHIFQTDWRAFGLGLFTVIFVVICKKVSSKIPGPLLALIISAIVVALTGWHNDGLATVGSIPRSLPPLSMPIFDLESIKTLLMPSLAIAILGVVEAYSIAKSFSAKSGDKINGNQEFIGQGLANISAGFFSGIPGTGSFTRSAVNFSSHAATRFAAMFSAFMVLIILLLFADSARFIPISSLAGILMIIASSMIDKNSFKLAFRATTSDGIVLIATMLATIFLHLDEAIYIGVLLSIVLFLRKVSHPHIFQVAPDKNTRKLLAIKKETICCPQISIFQVEGSLFFGAVAELEEKLSKYIRHGGKIAIVRLAHVRIIDATGVHALESLLKEVQARNITMMLANVKPAPMRILKKTGMVEKIGRNNFFDHTNDAIREAFNRINKLNKCKKCSLKCFEEC